MDSAAMHPTGALPTPSDAPVILALGSNLGDRVQHLRTGIESLAEHLRIEAISRMVETEPWGPVRDQGKFLNLVLRARTGADPLQVLDWAQEAERDAGRVRDRRYGPRTLDVDIIFFEERTVDAPGLTLPHPHWRDRPFVYGILPDVVGNLVDPVSGRHIAALVAEFSVPEEGLDVVASMPEISAFVPDVIR